MGLYPGEIRRCQHIKTNGTQCGSPALRNQEFCHYHREARPERVEVCGENGQTCGQVLVPVFEDASSIQAMVRQVAILLLQGKIDSKRAGQVLYALQIASANLKRMEAEKPRPVQVVVDQEKVAETPLGMTPWSAKGEGHDVEEEEFVDGEEDEGDEPREQRPSKENPAPEPTAEEIYFALTARERKGIRKKWHREGMISPKDWEDWLRDEGPDPLLMAIRRSCRVRDRVLREEERQEQAEICRRCKQECGERVEVKEAEAETAGSPEAASGYVVESSAATEESSGASVGQY